MNRNRLHIFILSIPLLLIAVGKAEAIIQRVDFCGGQYTATQPVPMMQLVANIVTVRGDFVDLLTGVTKPHGISVIIGNTTRGGGMNTTVQLQIIATSAGPTGVLEIKLNYAVEAGQPDIFKINVKIPKVDSVTVSPNSTNVPTGSRVTITVTGSNLLGLRLRSSARSHFTNLQDVTTSSNSTYAFSGNLQSSVSINQQSLVDSSMIADRISESCAVPTLGTGNLSLNVGLPDLIPTKPTGVYKLGAVQSCGSGSFATTSSTLCDRLAAPTTANPHVEAVVDVGPIIYIVKNIGSFPMPNQSFKVQLKFGINVLAEDIVQPLAPGAQKVLTYGRPTNKRKIMRDLNCAKCYDLNQSPLNWTDGQLTVVVDAGNQIAESNESNNSVISD